MTPELPPHVKLNTYSFFCPKMPLRLLKNYHLKKLKLLKKLNEKVKILKI